MREFLKNFRDGFGAVFVTIRSPKNYEKIPRDGFVRDRENLRSDYRSMQNRLAGNVCKRKLFDRFEGGYYGG